MSSSDLKLGFIGAGRAATALALGLEEQWLQHRGRV